MAQFGVIFLLFALGLEFSAAKVLLLKAFFVMQGRAFPELLYPLSVMIVNFILILLCILFFIWQLKVVRAVAVLGGLLQIILFMCLCGITASVIVLTLNLSLVVLFCLYKFWTVILSFLQFNLISSFCRSEIDNCKNCS